MTFYAMLSSTIQTTSDILVAMAHSCDMRIDCTLSSITDLFDHFLMPAESEASFKFSR